MKLKRRSIVIGISVFIVVLLATVASIFGLRQNPAEAVVQEYVEAAITQDRDRARDCVTSRFEESLDD